MCQRPVVWGAALLVLAQDSILPRIASDAVRDRFDTIRSPLCSPTVHEPHSWSRARHRLGSLTPAVHLTEVKNTAAGFCLVSEHRAIGPHDLVHGGRGVVRKFPIKLLILLSKMPLEVGLLENCGDSAHRYDGPRPLRAGAAATDGGSHVCPHAAGEGDWRFTGHPVETPCADPSSSSCR